ncbi:MAG: hypothetical protein Q8P24_16335 [Desulfobacterales bacterium]|nr:hypothetical protein [Desulfobacterales bacterium]
MSKLWQEPQQSELKRRQAAALHKKQRRTEAEWETERALVEANRKLIEVFEKKIQAKLVEIWGDEDIVTAGTKGT